MEPNVPAFRRLFSCSSFKAPVFRLQFLGACFFFFFIERPGYLGTDLNILRLGCLEKLVPTDLDCDETWWLVKAYDCYGFCIRRDLEYLQAIYHTYIPDYPNILSSIYSNFFFFFLLPSLSVKNNSGGRGRTNLALRWSSEYVLPNI